LIPEIRVVEDDILGRSSDGAEFERCDDSKRHACAAKSPEKFAVLGAGGCHEGSVGEYDLGREEEIQEETVGVGAVTLTAVEDMPADADAVGAMSTNCFFCFVLLLCEKAEEGNYLYSPRTDSVSHCPPTLLVKCHSHIS